ncbi:MAG: hypothetical protein H7A45_03875 [Verrucomicrobiales bacterium]|nr:hypothetical protein [Verrucomicrobiales bacterium]
MTNFLIIFSVVYLTFMVGYALFCWRSKAASSNPSEFLFAGGNIGVFLAFLGISATLFSTFTLQGMPGFFKAHGIGAWIFLGVTDVCLAGLLLFFGLRLREVARRFGNGAATQSGNDGLPMNLAELIKRSGHGRGVILFYALATTVFLIPYVTIQIKGASVLFQSAIPVGETHLFWSLIIVVLMLLYSTFGGIRAIFVTDAIQGIVLLVAAWAVAIFAIQGAGGVSKIFTDAAEASPALMSTPGPAGVLSWQFLVISFVSISLMPYVQPQLATRVLVARTDTTFVRATVGLAIFAILVIVPAIFIGLRGVVVSGESNDFLVNLLSGDVPPAFHALFIIGVVAAAMSTSDSQLLAVGTEWGSSISRGSIERNPQARLLVKLTSIFVAIVALLLAQTSFESLILFSVNSFIGTSFLLPIVYSVTVRSKVARGWLVALSVSSIFIFLLALFRVTPSAFGGIRVELYLYLAIGLTIAVFQAINPRSPQTHG